MADKSKNRFSWLTLNVQINVAWVIVAIVILLRGLGVLQ